MPPRIYPRGFAILFFLGADSAPPGIPKESIPHPELVIDLIYIFLISTKAKRDFFTTFINVFQSLLREGKWLS